MKLNLTLKERMGIRNLLNEKFAKSGLNIDSISNAQQIIKKTEVELNFSDKPDKPEKGKPDSNVEVYTATGGKEAQKVELKRVSTIQNGQFLSQFVWNEKKDKGMDIELDNNESKFLREVIAMKSEGKEFRIDEIWIAELNRKLQ